MTVAPIIIGIAAGVIACRLALRHERRAIIATRVDCYTAMLAALDDVKILAADGDSTTLANVLAQIRVAYEVHADLDVEIIHTCEVNE